MSTIAQFQIEHTQYLSPDGHLSRDLPESVQDPLKLIELYRWLTLTRLFDEKAINLQRTGKMGTYASCRGQEAISVALGNAMQADDVLLPAYREYGAQFQRGVRMTDILRYWGGDERGMDFQGNARQDFPISVPVASHAPQTIGVAYAMKLRKQARVAVCVLGDGATSKGDFYEAINAAGVWQLPALFIVNNNQWAISVPRSAQSHCQTLAQKAIGAGIDGEQVDGNDVVAMYHQTLKALNKARQGDGPTLIEAISYRMCDHTTADDARRYRSEQEVQDHQQLDPILRLKTYLTDNGHWSGDQDRQLHRDSSTEIEAAVTEYLDTPVLAPQSMFDYLYEILPSALQSQRLELGEGSSGHD